MARRKPKPRELFLSHSSADQKFVDKLARVLRKHGIKVWYSRHKLVGADQWHDEIGEALRRCDWFLVVLSANSVRSMWVKRELLFALKQPRLSDHIIPVVYRPCAYSQLSWALDDSQMVVFEQGFAKGLQRLLEVWDLQMRPTHG